MGVFKESISHREVVGGLQRREVVVEVEVNVDVVAAEVVADEGRVLGQKGLFHRLELRVGRVEAELGFQEPDFGDQEGEEDGCQEELKRAHLSASLTLVTKSTFDELSYPIPVFCFIYDIPKGF